MIVFEFNKSKIKALEDEIKRLESENKELEKKYESNFGSMLESNRLMNFWMDGYTKISKEFSELNKKIEEKDNEISELKFKFNTLNNSTFNKSKGTVWNRK